MTTPTIAPAPVDWSALQPGCESEKCDRVAVWACLAHDCDKQDWRAVLVCDPHLTEYRARLEALLPARCVCGIHWTSWRQVCPRQVRL